MLACVPPVVDGSKLPVSERPPVEVADLPPAEVTVAEPPAELASTERVFTELPPTELPLAPALVVWIRPNVTHSLPHAAVPNDDMTKSATTKGFESTLFE